MINHFRTLLVNTPGPVYVPGIRDATQGVLGAEALLVGYIPVVLPGYLQRVRTILFGRNPDATMLSYRVRQFLTVVHATELAEFVTALDPRLTYDYSPGVADAPFLSNSTFSPAITPFDGNVLFSGAPAAPDATGNVEYAFQIDVGGGEIQITSLRAPFYSQENAFTLTDGFSGLYPLGHTGYQCQFQVASGSWTVEGLLRPQQSLGNLATILRQSAATAVTQTLAGSVEPWLTFQNLWQQSPEFPQQFAAVICALAYQTEALRLATNG